MMLAGYKTSQYRALQNNA